LVQKLKRPILIAERCENQDLVSWSGCGGRNSFGILATAGARIGYAERLGAHFQQLILPTSLQRTKGIIRLSLA
jgi:hypothetical protein